MTRTEEKSSFYLTLILVLLAFIFTRVHELIHWVYAYVNNWNPTSTSGLITGFTEVTVPVPYSPTSLWIFYMLPSILIFATIMLVTVYHPDRFIRAMGIVIIGLNIASYSVEIPSSDSYNALQVLITSGYNTFYATAFHWIIYIIALITYVIYIYLVTDNNNKDVRNRINSIFK